MPTSRVRITVTRSAVDAWSLAADPSRLGRWWPEVDRVDRPTEGSYTRWVRSPRGRAVPMSFSLVSLEPNRSIAWEQLLEGTPFAKAVRSSVESIAIAGEDPTVIELSIRRKLRGTARLGWPFIVRGQRRELSAAAGNLKRALDG